MLPYAEFYQGLYCLLVSKMIISQNIQYFLFNYYLTPLDMYNGLYCIKPKRKNPLVY